MYPSNQRQPGAAAAGQQPDRGADRRVRFSPEENNETGQQPGEFPVQQPIQNQQYAGNVYPRLAMPPIGASGFAGNMHSTGPMAPCPQQQPAHGALGFAGIGQGIMPTGASGGGMGQQSLWTQESQQYPRVAMQGAAHGFSGGSMYQDIGGDLMARARADMTQYREIVDENVARMAEDEKGRDPNFEMTKEWRDDAEEKTSAVFSQFYHQQRIQMILAGDQQTIGRMGQAVSDMKQVSLSTADKVRALAGPSPSFHSTQGQHYQQQPIGPAIYQQQQWTDPGAFQQQQQQPPQPLASNLKTPGGTRSRFETVPTTGNDDTTATHDDDHDLVATKTLDDVCRKLDGPTDMVETCDKPRSTGNANDTSVSSDVSEEDCPEEKATITETFKAKASSFVSEKNAHEEKASVADTPRGKAADAGTTKGRMMAKIGPSCGSEHGGRPATEATEEAMRSLESIDLSDLADRQSTGCLRVVIEDPQAGLICITSPRTGQRLSPSPKHSASFFTMDPSTPNGGSSNMPPICASTGVPTSAVARGAPNMSPLSMLEVASTETLAAIDVSTPSSAASTSSIPSTPQFGLTYFSGTGLHRLTLEFDHEIKPTGPPGREEYRFSHCVLSDGYIVGILPGKDAEKDTWRIIASPDDKGHLKARLQKPINVAASRTEGDILAVLSNNESLCVLTNNRVFHHFYKGNGVFSKTIRYDIEGGVRASGMTADGLLTALGAKGIFSYQDRTLRAWVGDSRHVKSQQPLFKQSMRPEKGIHLQSNAPFATAVVTTQKKLQKICFLFEREDGTLKMDSTSNLGTQSDICVLACHLMGWTLSVRFNHHDEGGTAYFGKPNPSYKSNKAKDYFTKLSQTKKEKCLSNPIQAEVFLSSKDRRAVQPVIHAGVLTENGLSFIRFTPSIKDVATTPSHVDGARALASNGYCLSVLTVRHVATKDPFSSVDEKDGAISDE